MTYRSEYIPLPRRQIEQPDTSLKASIGALLERVELAEQQAEALRRQVEQRDRRLAALRAHLARVLQRDRRRRRRRALAPEQLPLFEYLDGI